MNNTLRHVVEQAENCMREWDTNTCSHPHEAWRANSWCDKCLNA